MKLMSSLWNIAAHWKGAPVRIRRQLLDIPEGDMDLGAYHVRLDRWCNGNISLRAVPRDLIGTSPCRSGSYLHRVL